MYVKKVLIPGADESEIINIEGCSVQVINLVTFIYDSARIRLDDESSVPLMPESIYCIGRKFSRIEIIGSEMMEGETVELLVTSFIQKPYIKTDLDYSQKKVFEAEPDIDPVGEKDVGWSLVPDGRWFPYRIVIKWDGFSGVTFTDQANCEFSILEVMTGNRQYEANMEVPKIWNDFNTAESFTTFSVESQGILNQFSVDGNWNTLERQILPIRLIPFVPPRDTMPTLQVTVTGWNFGNIQYARLELMEF